MSLAIALLAVYKNAIIQLALDCIPPNAKGSNQKLRLSNSAFKWTDRSCTPWR